MRDIKFRAWDLYFKLSLEIGKRTYHVGGLRATMGSIKKLVKGGIVFVHNK